MASPLRSLCACLVLVVLVPRCDAQEPEPVPCGGCGEGCSTQLWDPDARVVREYECTERNGSHDCVCDGLTVRVRTNDCSEALRRGCGIDFE